MRVESTLNLDRTITRIREKEAQGINNEQLRAQLLEFWELANLESEYEKKLFKKFKYLAAAGSKANGNRFILDYVFGLGLDWDILIVLGKKNIGKTYQQVKLINKIVAEGGEVMYVRMLAKEISTALFPLFNLNSDSDVYLKQKSGAWYFFHKYAKDENDEPVMCGYAASISTMQSMQAASYPNVRLIIWDEIVSDDGRAKIGDADLYGFQRFISSVVRDKTGVKTLLFGNLLSKVHGVAEDPVLNFFHISIDSNLKYLNNQDNKFMLAKVLFINTGDMFKGIESQNTLAGGDPEVIQSLLSNKIDQPGIKIVQPGDILNCDPQFGLVFIYDKEPRVLFVAEYKYWAPNADDPIRYWVVDSQQFKPTRVFGYKCWTNNAALSNGFSHCVKFAQPERWNHLIERLERKMACSLVLVVGSTTHRELPVYFHHLTLNRKKLPDEFKEY